MNLTVTKTVGKLGIVFSTLSNGGLQQGNAQLACEVNDFTREAASFGEDVSQKDGYYIDDRGTSRVAVIAVKVLGLAEQLFTIAFDYHDEITALYDKLVAAGFVSESDQQQLAELPDDPTEDDQSAAA